MIFTAVNQMIVNTSVVIMVFALCFLFFILIHKMILYMVSALTAVLKLFGIIEKMIVENTMHAKSLWNRESLINTCLTVYLKNPN